MKTVGLLAGVAAVLIVLIVIAIFIFSPGGGAPKPSTSSIYTTTIMNVTTTINSSINGTNGTNSTPYGGPPTGNLGFVGNFTVLAQTRISSFGKTSVGGDIGLSPGTSSNITGFSLVPDQSGQFATSPLVTGKIYAADYSAGPVNVTMTINNMDGAYADLMTNMNPNITDLGSGDIGGMTLVPGVYYWSTNVSIPTNITLSGNQNYVWIFVVSQNLSVGSGATTILSNGAQARNVFWLTGGQATLGKGSYLQGTVLAGTSITLNNGARLNGRAFAQTNVTLDNATVIAPN